MPLPEGTAKSLHAGMVFVPDVPQQPNAPDQVVDHQQGGCEIDLPRGRHIEPKEKAAREHQVAEKLDSAIRRPQAEQTPRWRSWTRENGPRFVSARRAHFWAAPREQVSLPGHVIPEARTDVSRLSQPDRSCLAKRLWRRVALCESCFNSSL